MTSELALKVTVVLGIVFVLAYVTRKMIVGGMDEREALLMAINPNRVLKHPWFLLVFVIGRVTMFAAIVAALVAATLWLMGA